MCEQSQFTLYHVKIQIFLLDIAVSKLNVREHIYIQFPCPCRKSTKPWKGKDQTFEGIKHFTPPSPICYEIGLNVLKSAIGSSASVCVCVCI